MRNDIREELIGVKENLIKLKESTYIWFKVLDHHKYCPILHLQELLDSSDENLIDISFYFAANFYRRGNDETQGLDNYEQATIDGIYNFIKRCNPDLTELEVGDSVKRHLIQLDSEKGL